MKESNLSPEDRELWEEYLRRELVFIEKMSNFLENFNEADLIRDQEYIWEEVNRLAQSIGLVIKNFSFDEDTLEPGWQEPANWKQRMV